MTDLRSRLQSTLGNAYTLEHELGGGGMSRVFVAEETSLGRKVVVKVLPTDLVAGVNADRFRREIQLAAKLQHPHIVPVLSSGQMDGIPYYTMPFVEGESLRARLARDGALPIPTVVSVLRDIARALMYAHDHGVVHRDIKPDNVLLSGASATVTDFGIAKAITAALGGQLASGTLTQVGTSLGTPAYMAPEQAAGDPDADHRVDIYAFGCLAYELLAAHAPFAGLAPQKMLAAQMGEAPRPISELRPDAPPALADLVMRCLKKDAADRPQSAAEIARLLESVTSDGLHAAMPPILLGGRGVLKKALAVYAVAFVGIAVLAKAAIVGIGLPDWVFPGALVVMALGLPVILFTAYVHRVTRHAVTATPTYTPGGTPSLAVQGTMATIAVRASPHMSWRRTTMGGAYAFGGFILLIGAYMLLRALGIGPAGSLLAAGKLKQNAKLLVVDFRTTGSVDSSLSPVVAEAIRTDLGQSNVVTVMPTSSIRSALQRMQRPASSKVDVALAREIAQREGIAAVVAGDITPLGAGYIVSARLITPESGDELASYRATADGPKDLIPAVERLSRDLRGKMGESLRSVHSSPPLEQVTTASLDALRKYTEANAIAEADIGRSIALLEEAIGYDSTFAMAWRKLSVFYFNGRYAPELSDSAATRAFRLRDRLTDTERADVDGFYYGQVKHDRVKEAEAYDNVVRRGEFASPAAHNLGLIFFQRHEYARADSLYRRIVATNDAALISYQNLIITLFDEGKPAAAESALVLAKAKFGQNVLTQRTDLVMAYAAGRPDSALRIAEQLRSGRDPFGRALGWNLTSGIEMTRGHLNAAWRAYVEAAGANAARGAQPPALLDSIEGAHLDVWFYENGNGAVKRLDAALAALPLRGIPLSQRPYFQAAGVYAQAGRPDRARAILLQYDKDVSDTALRRSTEPARHEALAEIALAEKRPRDAVDEFRRADRLPDGPADACPACLDARLGRAFDGADMADSAIAHFERFVRTPDLQRTIRTTDPYNLAPITMRLGELYEAKGDRSNAYKYYAKFVDMWKTADPPLQAKVVQARQRLARLQDVERK